MVDDLVGSPDGKALAAAGAAGGDHVRARGFGQLDGVATHRTAGTADQDPLPRCQASMLEERLVRGETDQRQRRRIGQRDAGRSGRQALCRRENVLGRRSVHDERQEADDPVADLEIAHTVAEHVDRSRDVEARDVRQRERHRLLHEPGPDVRVDAVERRRSDPDTHLAGARGGVVDILVAQDVWVAVVVESHCLHLGVSLPESYVFRIRSTVPTVAVPQSRSKCFEVEVSDSLVPWLTPRRRWIRSSSVPTSR